MEAEIGSIEAGKLADLVVLDDDLFEMDRNAIHRVKPATVMMEGQSIHGEFGGPMNELVRDLIPEAMPGSTVEDSIAAPVDYAKLD